MLVEPAILGISASGHDKSYSKDVVSADPIYSGQEGRSIVKETTRFSGIKCSLSACPDDVKFVRFEHDTSSV